MDNVGTQLISSFWGGSWRTWTFQTNAGRLAYEQEMELAKTESTEYKEENEALEKKLKDMQEAVESYKTKNKELYKIY